MMGDVTILDDYRPTLIGKQIAKIVRINVGESRRLERISELQNELVGLLAEKAAFSLYEQYQDLHLVDRSRFEALMCQLITDSIGKMATPFISLRKTKKT